MNVNASSIDPLAAHFHGSIREGWNEPATSNIECRVQFVTRVFNGMNFRVEIDEQSNSAIAGNGLRITRLGMLSQSTAKDGVSLPAT
jgi:hypothetical protein